MGDTILITLNNYELPTIKCSKSFKNIEWEDVDCFIFHSSSDGDIEIVQELNNLKGKVEKVIYVNKNINPLHYCIFTGLEADIYDTEDYLMDEEVLTYLINDYKNTGMTMKPAGNDLETLARSIATISTSSVESLQKLVSNGFWLKTLNTAVSNVDKEIVRASQININVVDMLTESAKLIEELKESHANTSTEIEKLTGVITDMERKTRPNTPFMFSTYHVPVTVPRVLYVKAYGHCRYLNSFLLSYQHYLKMDKQYSSKLIFLVPKLKHQMHRFRDVAIRLAPDSLEIVDFNSSSVFVSFEPKKSVMDAFFGQNNVQIFIVVDLMFGDVLVDGHMVKKLDAVSGFSDIQRFNLDGKRCIIPITARSENIQIPHINKYTNSNDATKRSLYFEKCAVSYKKLDNIIIENGR